MKTIKFLVNFGGYIGCDEEYEVEVDDEATQFEIDMAVQDEFERIIADNCSWEILEEEEEKEEEENDDEEEDEDYE